MHPLSVFALVVGIYLTGVALFLALMHGWLALDRLRSPRAHPLRATLTEIYWASISEWTMPLAYLLWPHWWRRPPGRRPVALVQTDASETRPTEAPSRAPMPVVFVHGWGQNRADFWGLAWRLRRDTAHPLYAFDYWFFGAVERSATRLGRVVDRALGDHGAERVHLVCHSLGGLVARALVEIQGGASRVASVTFIGSPLGGTRRAISAIGPAARQMTPQSPFLRALGEPEAPCGVTYHSIWSHSDALVVPPWSASLKGHGPELELEDAGHLGILYRPEVAKQVAQWLQAVEERAQAGNTSGLITPEMAACVSKITEPLPEGREDPEQPCLPSTPVAP